MFDSSLGSAAISNQADRVHVPLVVLSVRRDLK